MKAPNKCPVCGSKEKWLCVDKSKKGFSTGKAITGGLLLGGIGLAFGGLGKKNYILSLRDSNMNIKVNSL